MRFNWQNYHLSRSMAKPAKWPVRTAKTGQTGRVWSESLLCASWVAKDTRFLHADSEDSDSDPQADLSLRRAHMSFCWFCRAVDHFQIDMKRLTELLTWFVKKTKLKTPIELSRWPYRVTLKTGIYRPRTTKRHFIVWNTFFVPSTVITKTCPRELVQVIKGFQMHTVHMSCAHVDSFILNIVHTLFCCVHDGIGNRDSSNATATYLR